MKKMPKKITSENSLQKYIDQYLQKPYARILIPNEDGSYTSEILEFPGCISQGNTSQEAMENLEEAVKNWLQANLEAGRDIPSPCNDYHHSGRILIRCSKSLHQQAARMAAREGCSLNQWVVTSMAVRVGISDLFFRIIDKIRQPTVQFNATFSFTTTASIPPDQGETVFIEPNSVQELPVDSMKRLLGSALVR